MVSSGEIGKEKEDQVLRPAGPVFNSHAREGVVEIRPDFLEARRGRHFK